MAVLIGAIPPLMLKTAANPGGLAERERCSDREVVTVTKIYSRLARVAYGGREPGPQVLGVMREVLSASKAKTGARNGERSAGRK